MSGEGGFERATGPQGRRTARAILTGVGVVVVIALAALLLRDDGTTGQLEVEADPSPPPLAPEPVPRAPEVGTWEAIAPAPISTRALPVAVAAEDRVLVWGGRHDVDEENSELPTDGAVYLMDDDRWEPVPRAPIAGRVQPASAWTGEELLVWGGLGAGEPLADGARYDPRTQRWRPLADAPLSARIPLVSAWTGEELLVVGGLITRGQGLSELELSGTGAAYDPATDSWRQIAELPLGLRPRESRLSGAYAQGQLVVWDGLRGLGYDVASDTWELLDSPPVTLATGGPAVSTGDAVLVAQVYPRSDRIGYGLLVDPLTDRWDVVGLSPLAVPGRRHVLAVAGDRVAVVPVPDRGAEGQEAGALLDPSTGSWERLPLLRLRPETAIVGTPQGLLVWGGAGGGEPTAALWRR